MSRLFNLPLQTASDNKGVYTEEQLHAVLTLVYITIFLDTDPVKSFPLKQAAKTVAGQLGTLIETSIGGSGGWFGGNQSDPVSSHGSNALKGLAKSGMSTSDMAWHQVLPAAVSSVPTQGAAVRLLLLLVVTPNSQHVVLTLG